MQLYLQDGGFSAYDFKGEDDEDDPDIEKLKALAGAHFWLYTACGTISDAGQPATVSEDPAKAPTVSLHGRTHHPYAAILRGAVS